MNDIYKYLKFKLGSESADLEFEIIPIPPYEFIENNLSLEPYEYFGEISEILGCKVKQIILYYNADILMRVEMRFKGNVINHIKSELEQTDIEYYDTIMFTKMYLSEKSRDTILMYQSTILNDSSI